MNFELIVTVINCSTFARPQLANKRYVLCTPTFIKFVSQIELSVESFKTTSTRRYPILTRNKPERQVKHQSVWERRDLEVICGQDSSAPSVYPAKLNSIIIPSRNLVEILSARYPRARAAVPKWLISNDKQVLAFYCFSRALYAL